MRRGHNRRSLLRCFICAQRTSTRRILKESSLTTGLEPVDNSDTRWQNVRTRLPSLTHLELGKGSWAMRKQSLELRHMRAIVMLAEDLSYTKAARRLGISQPAVTRTIQDAEERLGRKLFERNRTNVNLTDAGRKYVPEAKTRSGTRRAGQLFREGSGSKRRSNPEYWPVAIYRSVAQRRATFC